MEDRTTTQLRVLHEMSEALKAERIGFWLRGGWAIDFHLGAVSRAHANIDIVVRLRARRRLAETLTRSGFVLQREQVLQTEFSRLGQQVRVMYLTRGATGEVITYGLPEWTWPPGSLARAPRTLNGVTVHVVSPEQLLREEEQYEAEMGRPPRLKDLVNMRQLRQIIRRHLPAS